MEIRHVYSLQYTNGRSAERQRVFHAERPVQPGDVICLADGYWYRVLDAFERKGRARLLLSDAARTAGAARLMAADDSAGTLPAPLAPG